MQRPGRAVRLWLVVAAAGALSACAARSAPPSAPRGVGAPGAVPTAAAAPAPAPTGSAVWSTAPPSALRPVISTAVGLVGVPYRDGGADPAGFDCSGFVHYVFGFHGWRVPRTVTAQYAAGQPVRDGEVRPGDLLFFATLGNGPTHVAIALESGRFVHAPSGRGRVRVESLSGRYWPPRYLGARRLAAAP